MGQPPVQHVTEPQEDQMIVKLTKRQEKVNMWKNKLTRCSFVLATISSFGVAASLLPFIAGPPPELREWHHGKFPDHHSQPDHRDDHMSWENSEWDHERRRHQDRWNDEPRDNEEDVVFLDTLKDEVVKVPH